MTRFRIDLADRKTSALLGAGVSKRTQFCRAAAFSNCGKSLSQLDPATPHAFFVAIRMMGLAVRKLRTAIAAAWVAWALCEPARAQDAAAGEQTFKQCHACHQIGEGAHNAVGPVLNGVVGRKAGAYPDYSYSDANRSSGIVWDEATLAKYLKSPRDVVPGTRMTFAGLKRDSDIANVIAYLETFGPDGKKP